MTKSFCYLWFTLCIWILWCIYSSLLAHDITSPSISPSCCKLAPNGTLTLGAAHKLVNGKILIFPLLGMSGKLSLFRLWGRERSKQEVMSLNCTEGELVKWERDNWDTQTCTPLPDSTLQCGESIEWNIFCFYWNTFSLIVPTKVHFVSNCILHLLMSANLNIFSPLCLPQCLYRSVSDWFTFMQWM